MWIAFDTSGLEVDQSGLARSIAGLRDALRADGRVALLELARSPALRRRRLVRDLQRELAGYWNSDEVLDMPARSAEQREPGLRRAGRLTWQACADATIAAYEAGRAVS